MKIPCSGTSCAKAGLATASVVPAISVDLMRELIILNTPYKCATPYSASAPVSPVRMRKASLRSIEKTLPSPILPDSAVF